VGVAQMLGFKQLWTNNFSDAMLLLLSFCALGFSQVFVVNWVPKVRLSARLAPFRMSWLPSPSWRSKRIW
jgi:uncharacterized membrane protein